MNKTILLVEDEALIAMNEAAVLEKYGFRVVTVHSGHEAVVSAEDGAVDLILMDINLGKGEMDGTEAARRILAYRELPVVFLSSHTEPEIVEKTEEITSYGYVVKNSGETVLIASIKMAFRLYEAKKKEKERELLFHNLFSHMPIGSAVYEVHGNGRSGKDYIITNFNNASLQMEGKTLEEVVGKSLYDLRPNIDAYGLIQVMRRVWKSGKPESLPPRLYRDEQFENYYENHVFRISTGEVVTVYTDVTDYYRLLGEVNTKSAENLKIKEFYETILETIHEGIWVSDGTDKIIFANTAMETIAGVPRDRIVGLKVLSDFPEETVEEFSRYYTRAQNELIPVGYQTKVVTPAGKQTIQKGWLLPLTEDGVFSGMICTIQDITEHYQAERALEHEINVFQLLIDSLPDSVFFKDQEHRFFRVNRAKAEEHNTVIEEMIGKTDFDFSIPPSAEQSRKDDEQVLKTGVPIIDKEEIIISGGTDRWRLTTKLPLRSGGGPIIGTMGVSRDINGQKQAEKKLRDVNNDLEKALTEKDFLMQELNHRIKNNLLMISSLIRLKESSLPEEADLRDIENQIDAIRILHEKLNPAETLSRINFREYIQDVVMTILVSFSRRRIRFENMISEMEISTRTAIPLGLIINELATNAIKHGCENNGGCTLTVKMVLDPENNRYILNVSNTGRPFPPDVDVKHSDTLGLRLITALVHQLDGTMELEGEPFPQFTFVIPAEPV